LCRRQRCCGTGGTRERRQVVGEGAERLEG
jgi:hypothetical protein